MTDAPANAAPVTTDDVLGPVTWSGTFTCWEAHVNVGRDERVTLLCKIPDVPTAVAHLRLLAAWLPVGGPAGKRYAAVVLLGQSRDYWVANNDPRRRLTPPTVARRIILSSAWVFADGRGELGYTEIDDIFGETWIGVRTGPDGEFADVMLYAC